MGTVTTTWARVDRTLMRVGPEQLQSEQFPPGAHRADTSSSLGTPCRKCHTHPHLGPCQARGLLWELSEATVLHSTQHDRKGSNPRVSPPPSQEAVCCGLIALQVGSFGIAAFWFIDCAACMLSRFQVTPDIAADSITVLGKSIGIHQWNRGLSGSLN